MNISIITARKRSLGQGNIFIGVCQEFCSRGGGHVWFPGGVCMVAGGAYVVAVHGCGGACMVVWGHVWLWGAYVGYDEIRSMSGRYVSYWNAFLLWMQSEWIKYLRLLSFSKRSLFFKYFDQFLSVFRSHYLIPHLILNCFTRVDL